MRLVQNVSKTGKCHLDPRSHPSTWWYAT